MDWMLLGGSVAGVLGLAAAAWLLRLGGGAIGDVGEARRIAEEALGGFEAVDAVVSEDGAAAVVLGSDAVALIKMHGTQPAVRLLPRPVRADATDEGVRIDSGERMFGPVRLRLGARERDKVLTMV